MGEKAMNGYLKRGLAFLMTMLLFLGTAPMDRADAAKKTVKLSCSSAVLETGKNKRITVKNTTGKKIKKVRWKVTKGAKYLSLSSKKGQSIKVKAKKTGNATVTAKITLKNKKTYTKKLKVRVVKAVSASNLKMSASKVSLQKGKTQTVAITNKTGQKISSVKWNVTGGKGVVSVSGTKKKGTIKAVKAGSAQISTKIKLESGTVTRTIRVTVTEEQKKNDTGESAEKTETETPVAAENREDDLPLGTTKELLHYTMKMSADGKKLLDDTGNGNDATLVDVGVQSPGL